MRMDKVGKEGVISLEDRQVRWTTELEVHEGTIALRKGYSLASRHRHRFLADGSHLESLHPCSNRQEDRFLVQDLVLLLEQIGPTGKPPADHRRRHRDPEAPCPLVGETASGVLPCGWPSRPPAFGDRRKAMLETSRLTNGSADHRGRRSQAGEHQAGDLGTAGIQPSNKDHTTIVADGNEWVKAGSAKIRQADRTKPTPLTNKEKLQERCQALRWCGVVKGALATETEMKEQEAAASEEPSTPPKAAV